MPSASRWPSRASSVICSLLGARRQRDHHRRCERACLAETRVRRQRPDAALVLRRSSLLEARTARGHSSRAHPQPRSHCLRSTHQRVDAGRPQWPWRLATTAATIHARTSKKKASEVDQEATSNQSSQFKSLRKQLRSHRIAEVANTAALSSVRVDYL